MGNYTRGLDNIDEWKDDWLNRIVKCPKCNNDVRDGDRIWLDGECLCPDCYTHKRQRYDELKQQGYEQALKHNNLK